MRNFDAQTETELRSESRNHRLWPSTLRVWIDVATPTVLLVAWLGLEYIELESRRFVFRILACGLALIGPFQKTLPTMLARFTIWIAMCGIVWGLWYARDEGHFGITWSALWLLVASSWTLFWKFVSEDRNSQ